MKLFIIRHGDPDYEHDSLTDRGKQEADLLCDRLLRENIRKIYCSPLGRAQRTAQPFAQASGLPIETRDFLREFYKPVNQYGDPDHLSCPWDLDPALFMEHQAEFSDLENWSKHPLYREYGVDEGAALVRAELDRLLSENGLDREGILYRKNDRFTDGDIAIFCHMGLGSLLLADLAFMAPPLFWQMFRFMPTAVSTIVFSPINDTRFGSKIFSVGDTSHLSPIGLTYRG